MGALLSVVGLGFLAPFFTFVFSSDGTPDRNPIIHFAAKPAILTVKKGGEGDDLENLSFQTLVQTRCPSLYTKFRPLWWLFKFVVVSKK
ncbi:hypothetical protein H0H93_001370 [Arthromyces matolae]|nr:hypothetical protein H0H93_001370 [Arthromyces matolae]